MTGIFNRLKVDAMLKSCFDSLCASGHVVVSAGVADVFTDYCRRNGISPNGGAFAFVDGVLCQYIYL